MLQPIVNLNLCDYSTFINDFFYMITALILLYYIVLYAIIVAYFAVVYAIFFVAIDKNWPRLQGKASILQLYPGKHKNCIY